MQLLDPIDGTRGFVEGNKALFVVCLTVYRNIAFSSLPVNFSIKYSDGNYFTVSYIKVIRMMMPLHVSKFIQIAAYKLLNLYSSKSLCFQSHSVTKDDPILS